MRVNIDGAPRIEATALTKRYGDVVAVEGLDLTVEPGAVTGFLGPNGAGKTTVLRMLLGLVRPDAGRATIGGVEYAALPAPAHVVGAALDATGFHPSRTGRNHLRVYATVHGLPESRVDEVLALVELSGVARRRVGGYSLGMRQRLALAAALLADPAVLVLDEPANGLDPDGARWLRTFLRGFADSGGSVLVSSHVLSEMQQLVDRVAILDHGRLVWSGSAASLADVTAVLVRTPDPDLLTAAVTDRTTARVRRLAPDLVEVAGPDAAEVGRIALRAGIELHELTPRRTDLEQAYVALTAASGAGAA
jgi:ABC-2 type transport system ATP-binding protein